MIRIVTYEPCYKDDFIRLNKQWIETYHCRSGLRLYLDIILSFFQTRYTIRSLASTCPLVWDFLLDDQ